MRAAVKSRSSIGRGLAGARGDPGGIGSRQGKRRGSDLASGGGEQGSSRLLVLQIGDGKERSKGVRVSAAAGISDLPASDNRVARSGQRR
ncbi:hypothetical protein ACJRO7_022432 [Eucalyptus globulus]|uniref:Uncharacterized protein n=1 Tax=Eucalyptus globulus TaxID=34317 RepID=A0ABD3JZ12_EUCGL